MRNCWRRWINGRDSAAFELLLWRHGPMVLSTCRRLLPRREDAEDAFQAVFLVLLRKAASIRHREALAAWLHRVACRISLRMRTAVSQRASREQPLENVPAPSHVEEAALSDLRTVLDEEIDRLPVHYRRALILCCLEGKTQEEAAQLLACPRGTVSSWLTRGRERLRQRLLRRGIVVSTAGLAVLTPDTLAMGGVLPLIGSLLRVAGGVAPAGLLSCRTIALAEGMLRMMLLTKVKVVSAVLFVAVVLASGVGTISHSMRAADPPIAPQATNPRLAQQTPRETPKDARNRWQLNLDDLRLREEDGIAWGKAAHGLQAGIAFRPGDQSTFEVGQSVTFVVYLHNVSDKEIRLSHAETLFEERLMPVVEDADGERLYIESRGSQRKNVPIVHRSVMPGQQITLGYPWLRIRPLGWQGLILGPYCRAVSGRYKVGFTGLPLRLNDDKANVSGLATGRVELEIRGTEVARSVIINGRAEKDSLRVFYVSSNSVGIPIHCAPEGREQMARIMLLVSDDEGKTYNRVDDKPAHAKQFRFKAPRDRMYWFVVQLVDKHGSSQPANPSRARPSMKMCVDTSPPVAFFQSIRPAKGASPGRPLVLAWTATDSNLEETPITLEWAEKTDGPWNLIGAGPRVNSGRYVWRLPEHIPARFHVRLRVRDKAGNESISTQPFPNK